MNKQQAIEIIEREPVGGAQYYNERTDLFYSRFDGVMFFFIDEWTRSVSCTCGELSKSNLTPMHEILEIALGEY